MKPSCGGKGLAQPWGITWDPGKTWLYIGDVKNAVGGSLEPVHQRLPGRGRRQRPAGAHNRCGHELHRVRLRRPDVRERQRSQHYVFQLTEIDSTRPATFEWSEQDTRIREMARYRQIGELKSPRCAGFLAAASPGAGRRLQAFRQAARRPCWTAIEVGSAVGIVAADTRIARRRPPGAPRAFTSPPRRRQRRDADASPRRVARTTVVKATAGWAGDRRRQPLAAAHDLHPDKQLPESASITCGGIGRPRSCALRRKLTATTSATAMRGRAPPQLPPVPSPGRPWPCSMTFSQASFRRRQPRVHGELQQRVRGVECEHVRPSSDTRRARANSSSMSMAKLLRTEARSSDASARRRRCRNRRPGTCTCPASRGGSPASCGPHVAAALEHAVTASPKDPAVDHEVEIAVRPACRCAGYIHLRHTGPFTTMD